MVDIIHLAEGVAERIGEADVELAPEYSIKDVKEKTRIVVVPVGIKHKMLARGFREDFLTIHVGVLRKTTEDELVDLVNYAQTLALDFLHTTVKGAKCVEANHTPLYVPDHMRERRQFTGVIELLFKEVNEHRVPEAGG
ncbi:MAG: hypothetical protein II840_13580 [Kiritimatiellae bacterium]|nr:hypothetical protein [Kiritimatiellia bacterium]